MTRELRKRRNLTMTESMKVYTPAWGMGLGILLLIPSIVYLSLHHNNGFAITGLLLGAVAALANFIWLCIISDGSHDFRWRQQQVRLDRYRRGRAHRGDERRRAKDMKRAYVRYSVAVERSGTDVVLTVISHTPRKVRSPIHWEATRTKKSYDGYGHYEGPHAKGPRISEPTVETVWDALHDFEHVAADLEASAYANALKIHAIDTLALAMQPPPASPRARARVERAIINAEIQAQLLTSGEDQSES